MHIYTYQIKELTVEEKWVKSDEGPNIREATRLTFSSPKKAAVFSLYCFVEFPVCSRSQRNSPKHKGPFKIEENPEKEQEKKADESLREGMMEDRRQPILTFWVSDLSSGSYSYISNLPNFSGNPFYLCSRNIEKYFTVVSISSSMPSIIVLDGTYLMDSPVVFL